MLIVSVTFVTFFVFLSGYVSAQSTITDCEKIPVKEASASKYSSVFYPNKTIDGITLSASRWSVNQYGAWLTLDLGSVKKVCDLEISWYKGHMRKNSFTVSVSEDGINRKTVFSGMSSGTTSYFEKYEMPDTDGRYVRITVYGNSWDNYASIKEVRINGHEISASLKIIAPYWLPYVSNDQQLNAYQSVTQDYDWPKMRMGHDQNSVDADDLENFKKLRGNKILSVTTLKKIKDHAAWAKSQGFAAMEYNLEPGFNDPAGIDPVAAMKEAANVAHSHGMKLVATPTRWILKSHGTQMAPYVDMIHIQAQTLQDDNTPEEFDKFVSEWIPKLKEKNPNLLVTVQVSANQPAGSGLTLLNTLEESVSSAIDVADGVSVWFGNGDEELVREFFEWYHQEYRIAD